MALPWKKSKLGRIFRLVADLRSPPRHGGSLVVETGFPTSVIDLIVKNRDRLKKKPSIKKKKDGASEELVKVEPVTSLSSLTTVSNFSSGLVSSNPSAGLVVSSTEINNSKRPPTPTSKEILPSVANVEKGVTSKGVIWWNGTFMITVKVLFMLILALAATKKIVVGITISTFLLMFLEFLVLRVFCLLDRIPLSERLRSRAELITENISSMSETYQSSIEEIELVDIDFDSLGSERRWGIGLTDDYRSRGEEIKLGDPDFAVIGRRWSSETDTNLRERHDLSRIDQARCEEIQPSKPESRLSTRERRWGSDPRGVGKAQSIRQLLEAEKIKGRRFSEGDQARRREIEFVEPLVGLLTHEKRCGFADLPKTGKNPERVEQIIQGVADLPKTGKNPERVEQIIQGAVLRNRKTSNGRIKTKKLLKKLVPKKFRGSKKKADDLKSQPDSGRELFVGWDEEVVTSEEQEQREEAMCEQGGSKEQQQLEEIEEEEEKEVNCFNYVPQADTESRLVEGNGRRRENNYGYIIIITIVLAGLVHGRPMALAFTMAWFLVKKSVQTMKRLLKIT